MGKKAKQTPLNIQKAAKILTDAASYQHNLSTLFRDFVTITSITLRNSCEPKDEAWHARENEYLETIRRYNSDTIDAMAECLGSLVLIANEGHSDHLGELYMHLGIGSASLGQFFTPYHISRMMAQMVFSQEGIAEAIAEKGYISVLEPTCGAGGMVVAAADVISSLGYDPLTQLRVTAQDIDAHCCRMTYINCALHQIPAKIVLGNALLMEERETVFTPAVYLLSEKPRLSDAA